MNIDLTDWERKILLDAMDISYADDDAPIFDDDPEADEKLKTLDAKLRSDSQVMARVNRHPTSRLVETAIAKLVNNCSRHGFSITRFGPEGDLDEPWYISVFHTSISVRGRTLGEAVDKALKSYSVIKL